MTSTGNFFFGTPFPNFSVNNDRVLDNLRVRQPNTFKCPPATKQLINPNHDDEKGKPLPLSGDNNPVTNATLRSGCAQAGALVYCTTPILNKDGDNPATDGCRDGRNHLYFSNGDTWIPLSNCLPEDAVDCRCLGQKVLQRTGRCQVPYGYNDPADAGSQRWVPVDDRTDTTDGAPGQLGDSQSFVQIIVPPGNSPSYVDVKFQGYLAQRQVPDLPPADKVFLGIVVQTKEADGEWPVPPSKGNATPKKGHKSTAYQRAYTFLMGDAKERNGETKDDFAQQGFLWWKKNVISAELSGQVVNWSLTADLSDHVGEEVRIWIVTKSDDENPENIRNYIWTWGKTPFGAIPFTDTATATDATNTRIDNYEDLDDPSKLPAYFNSRPPGVDDNDNTPVNNYPPIILSASQPPSNVEVIE